MSFGEFIKKERNAQGKTLKDIAEKIGISYSFLSQIENGDRGIPKPETLVKLAKALDIPYMKLMYLAGYVKEQDSSFSLIDKSIASPNSFNIINDNMATRKKLDFPINDLHFHLIDENNKKMYKNIILDDDDREYVNSMIEVYLLRKYEIKKHDRDNKVKFTDEDFKKIENDIKNKNFKWEF